MRKERKSRAKSISSQTGRPRVDNPRMTCHLMLSRAEREACDVHARRRGLGFSPWARCALLAELASDVLVDKVPPSSVGNMVQVMTLAILHELHDLPWARREKLQARLVKAVSELDELEARATSMLGDEP